MLAHYITFICSIIGAIIMSYISSYLLEFDNNKRNRILISILFTIIIFLSVKIKYSAESTLFKLTLFVIALKVIYKKSVYKTVITIFMTIMLLSIGDLTSTLIFIKFISIEEMKSVWYWILICNITVYIITVVLFSIPYIKNKLKNFIANQNDEGKFQTAFLIVSSVIVIVYILYNISVNYKWNEKYILNIIIAITYIVIVIIFLKDKADYMNLVKQYDCLFDYFKDLEETIDDISLVNHEYKNQLAVLKSYIENNRKEDALKYLSDIIKDSSIEDEIVLSELKFIPKGGIKGVLYYKIITARNKNVTIVLDVGKKVKKELERLTYEETKTITKIIGVYIDNAIEAVAISNNKIINIEIYNIDNKINMVISNPINTNDIDLNKIFKKGYTTKGKGRGRGLYLVNKMINRNNILSSETKIIKNYFIQKIIISK